MIHILKRITMFLFSCLSDRHTISYITQYFQQSRDKTLYCNIIHTNNFCRKIDRIRRNRYCSYFKLINLMPKDIGLLLKLCTTETASKLLFILQLSQVWLMSLTSKNCLSRSVKTSRRLALAEIRHKTIEEATSQHWQESKDPRMHCFCDLIFDLLTTK